MIADALLFFEPRLRTQPQHVVVSKTHTAEGPGKRLFLRGRRIKPEAVGAFDVHVHTLHAIAHCVKPQHRKESGSGRLASQAALSLLGLKAGVSRAN